MKLHLGCGKVILPGWVNVDLWKGGHWSSGMPDTNDDARTLNKIADGSAELIYASHLLDHFSRHEVADVLKCWHRKLEPGGTLRLAVSDFRAVVQLYTGGVYFSGEPCKLDLSQLLGHIVGGHKTELDKHGVVFDEDSLTAALLDAGFVNVRRWDWRKTEHAEYDDFSQAYWPHMDKKNGRLMSLNLEADKPLPKAEPKSETIGTAFYKDQIAKHGLSPLGSVPDEFVREREIAAIMTALQWKADRNSRILEVGCGSGLLLAELRSSDYENVTAIDALPEFIELARSRNTRYDIEQADVRKIPSADGYYDVVISERCVINLMSRDDQQKAWQEIRRVLRRGGILIAIEAFAAAWRNLNEAREEFCLDPLPMAAHNRWFEPGEFEADMEGMEPVDAGTQRHFLSSHYYVSRVLHDVLLQANRQTLGEKGSHFVRFLSPLLNVSGEYANIQFHCFRKVK